MASGQEGLVGGKEAWAAGGPGAPPLGLARSGSANLLPPGEELEPYHGRASEDDAGGSGGGLSRQGSGGAWAETGGHGGPRLGRVEGGSAPGVRPHSSSKSRDGSDEGEGKDGKAGWLHRRKSKSLNDAHIEELHLPMGPPPGALSRQVRAGKHNSNGGREMGGSMCRGAMA